MAALLIVALFLPILLSPVVYVVGRKVGAKSGWFSFVVLLVSTLLLLLASSTSSDYLESYPWDPIGKFGLRLDGLSLPFASIILLLCTVLSVYSIPYMIHRIEEQMHAVKARHDENFLNRRLALYQFLYLLYAAGMFGTVLATNLIQFYIFFELMLIPSFFLIAEFGYGEKERISLMYFIWTHAGALVLLSGILAAGFLSGNFDISLLKESAIDSTIRSWIAVAITIGFFVKLAAFGVHIWLPYAHAEAPTPISALLSPAMIGIGGYGIIRLLTLLLPNSFSTVTLGMSLWGLITLVYGAFMALQQDDIKRFLAYSSVSQMGYIIFGIATAYYLGISGSVMQYVSHGTGKAILFMTAGVIILQTNGIRSIKQLGGLAPKLPVTATAAMIGVLAIVGIPPTNGFVSEVMIFAGAFTAALRSGSMLRLTLSVLAIIGTAFSAGYALLLVKRVFFGGTPKHLSEVKEGPITMVAPLLVLAFVTILLGIYPSIFVDRLVPLIRAAGG